MNFFINFIIFIIIAFTNISYASDLGNSTDYRFDQSVPSGCSASWFGKGGFFDAIFNGGTGSGDNIQLSCNGKRYDYWYTNMTTALWAWGGLTCGKHSGACRGGVANGSWWVNGARMDNNNNYFVQVCNSYSGLSWIAEKCQYLQAGSVTHNFNAYWGAIKVDVQQFDSLNPGLFEGTAYNVNSSGYMYGLYNNDCPYNNQGSSTNCTVDTIKSGYTVANNCYLLAKQYIPARCASATLCPCSKIISCSQCVPNKLGKVTNAACGCNADGKKCKCSKDGSVQCDKYSIPLTTDPNYKLLSIEQKKCYECNATARTIYNNCADNVKSVYPNIASVLGETNGTDVMKSIYGPGTYVCAYASLLSQNNRVGCAKTKLGLPPRYFPRIARYSNTNAGSGLFTPAASVRQFRDITFYSTKPQFGVCGYGPPELGEAVRGTFFKPIMHVVFGETDFQIEFDVQSTMYTNGSPDMELLYGLKDPARIATAIKNSDTVNSPWNEGSSGPIKISYSVASDNNCNITQKPDITTQICTRLEYDPSTGISSYAAYQINMGSVCSTCAACEKITNGLVPAGKVPRPPMKYKYLNGNAITPINISPINVAIAPSAPNVITISPATIPTVTPRYHANLLPMKANLYSKYYNVKVCANATNSLPDGCLLNLPDSVKGDPSCAILFGHEFCVDRDQCSLLYDLNQFALTEINTPNCKTINCTLNNTLKKLCTPKTYCPTTFSTTEKCLKSTPQYLIGAQSQTTLSYYNENIQWQDETCISTGFAPVAHSTEPISLDTQYGQYGDPSYDSVITFIRGADNNLPLRPLRNASTNDDNANSSIIPVPINAALNQDITGVSVYLSKLKDASNNFIAQSYFNTQDASTIASKIGLRPRTMRELNLCVPNSRDNFTTWDYVFNPGIGWYDIYLPLRCQYLEYTITGGQGGGSNLTTDGIANARTFLGTCSGVDGTVGYVECDNDHYRGNPLDAKSGSSGAIVSGILNNNKNQEQFLSFFIGSGAKTQAGDTSDAAIYTCYTPCGGIWNLRCPFHGNGYIGEQNSYIIKTSNIPSANLTQVSTISQNDTMFLSVAALSGVSTYNKCQHKGIVPGGLGADILNEFGFSLNIFDQVISNPIDVYGDRSFITGLRQGSSVTTNTGTATFASRSPPVLSDGSGADGTAVLKTAKVQVNGYTEPILSGFQKIIGGQTRDPQCRPMCPRINIKMTVGSLELICEYGGAAYNTENVFVSLVASDFQVPAGFTALPTRCFSLDGGIIYYPSSSFFDTICPSGTVIDNNRFYGLCTSTDLVARNQNSYLTEFYQNTGSYWNMTGTYCPNGACPVNQLIESRNNITTKVLPILQNQDLYGLKCESGGLWDMSIGGAGTPIRRLAQLPLYCPAINGDIFPFPGSWSMGVNWPLTKAGSVATAASCREGFIPNSTSSNFNRKCGPSGIWKGVDDIVNSICLYSCQLDQDPQNYIQWDLPDNFSSGLSVPTCMDGPVTSYFNGNQVIKNTRYVWPSGVNGQNFKRKCNIPGASDPMQYLYVNAKTKDPSVMPYWSDRPNDAKCVPPSFTGQCLANLNVCYNSGVNGASSFASCYNNNIYNINGIPTYPPEQLITNTTITPTTNSNINMIASDIYATCSFDSDVASVSYGSKSSPLTDFNCLKLNTDIDVFYQDILYNNSYYRRGLDISWVNNTNLSTLNTVYNDNTANTVLLQKINNDIPSDVNNCTFTSSSSNYNAIRDYMISNPTGNSYCSNICYLPNSQTMTFYDCTQIPPDTALCAPICSQTSETWYYFDNVKLVKTTQSNGTLIGQLSASNTSYCINQGIKNAMPYLHKSQTDLGLRSSNYCKQTSYTGPLPIQNIIYTSVNNPAFNNMFSQSNLSCHVPQQCTLPNSLGTLNHQKSAWVFVFDSTAGFTTQSTILKACSGGNQYVVSGNNINFVKLYCYDGSLFSVERSSNISFITTPDTCFVDVPPMTDIARLGSTYGASFIKTQNLSSINQSELTSPVILTDITAGAMDSKYNILRNLTT